MKHITKKPSETQQLGEEFASKLKGGDIVLLYGDLGAGKTTFMQGFAKGLGIEKRIISPTFIIIRRYELSAKLKIQNAKVLYHIDLYRTQTEDDLKGLGMEEILEQEDAIVAIEWPEKLGSFIPKNRWDVRFVTIDENTREIAVEELT